MSVSEFEIAAWRRQVGELYAAVRAAERPQDGHALWRAGRDRLFRSDPQSPLEHGDPLRRSGLPYWPYDARLRFELPLLRSPEPAQLALATDGHLTTMLLRVGRVELPPPLAGSIDVWWMDQYGGGLFVPLRDGTAGQESYGGGRYVLDTAKGADLGGSGDRLVIDLNFLYHPSCRYAAHWQCPLAPTGNVISAHVHAGERL